MKSLLSVVLLGCCFVLPAMDCFGQSCRCAKPACGAKSACGTKFGRLQSPGNLAPHVPYRSLNFYYYDRPYNAGQAEQRMYESAGNAFGNTRQPYSSQMFEQIFQDFESDSVNLQLGEMTGESPIDGYHESVWRDKYLEYSDWQRHRTARQEWLTDQQREQHAASESEQSIQIERLPASNYQPASNSLLERLYEPRTFRPRLEK